MLVMPLMGQQDTVRQSDPKARVLSLLEEERSRIFDLETEEGRSNFDRWAYSQKDHAVVGYYGTIFQYGFNEDNSVAHWHHDLGAYYRGRLVKSDFYKLNVEAWAEQSTRIAGKPTKDMAAELGMFSLTNGNTVSTSSLRLEYLYVENYFFNGFLDVTLGKLDQLFLTTFTDYGGWDKMTFFSKTAASDPVPPIDAAFGVFTELNISQHFSLGGMVTDTKDDDFIDIGNFFSDGPKFYQVFARGAYHLQRSITVNIN